MKLKLFVMSLLALGFSSCIKSEAPYQEADIVQDGFSLKEEGIISNVIYKNNLIEVIVDDIALVFNAEITPIIQISEGATIVPASGETVRVNNTKLAYTVTSQNGVSKPYIINFRSSIPPSYDFESWAVNESNKNKPYDYLTDNGWDSGNAGVRIMVNDGHIFPTRKSKDSYGGEYAALLETQLGNIAPGSLTHTPIFSGSLFRGKFTLSIFDPVTSPKFGQVHTKDLGKPILFTGYYKYKSGEVFTDEKPNPVPDRKDECDIYAVLYKVAKGDAGLKEYLTARNVKTSDKIVATALLEDWVDLGESTERDEYTYFEIPFKYKEGEETLDYDVNNYKLALVMASSKEGAFFRGSVGSKLYVDDVDVICDKTK